MRLESGDSVKEHIPGEKHWKKEKEFFNNKKKHLELKTSY